MDLSSREQINTAGILLTFAVACFLAIPVDMLAQQSTRQQNNYPTLLQKKIQQLEKQLKDQQQGQTTNGELTPVPSGVDYQSLNENYIVFEQDQMWNRNPNPNPSQNFALFEEGIPAGNINGDSSDVDQPIDDYIVTSRARNEQTATLEDQTWKTAVFFGDNTSGTPDQVIYRKLVPVGDINGDGYSDAVAVDASSSLNFPTSTNNEPYIYKGTPNGYVNTNIIFDAGDLYDARHVGFNDYNYDGYTDILTYSPNDTELYITWGRGFSDGSFSYQTFMVDLPYSSKSVTVANADKDSLKEIAVLSGYSGDGQIHVLEVDTMAQSMSSYEAITYQQSFSYTGFEGYGEDSNIHFTDINGDTLSDLYVRSPRYNLNKLLLQNSNNRYNTAPLDLPDGNMKPTGDLNNDGNDDFVVGDPTRDGKAAIAYGPSDTTRTPLLQIDENLNGNTSTDWSWSKNYGQQTIYPGDFNGDGVEDALIGHREQNGSNGSVGRRILSGVEESTQVPTSTFQLYANENFYSSVVETEELGDINNDGVDDFALVMYSQQKVEIYFGGTSLSESPDKIIKPGYSPYGITSGDFDGDGIDDLVVPGYHQDGARMNIYLGGSQFDVTADNTIKASDFQSADNPDIFNGQNIGDVNDDGVEDFLIGSSQASNSVSDTLQYINEAYLFYGGSSIGSKTSPDVTLNIASPSGDYIWSGESSAALGDINGDGVDDFAVSAAYLQNKSSNSRGQVQVFYGGSNPDFSSPDKIIAPQDYNFGFGWSITAGDFDGNGQQDIAVSSVSIYGETIQPASVLVYDGGPDMDTAPDRFLLVPRFVLQDNANTDEGLLLFNYGKIETIPDFTYDGKDELLVSTSGVGHNGSHAALFTFNRSASSNYYLPSLSETSTSSSDTPEISLPEMAIKAPNIGSGLGGGYNIAVGDFTDNGEVDLVLAQPSDDNDAYNSSRVYRYGLTEPLKITKVEDVPDDQGRRIRIHTGGFLLKAMNYDIYGMDNWSIWRMTVDSSWTNVKTISPSNNGSQFVDVTVNKTQPTNVDSVDYSYTFRLEAFNRDMGGVIAGSDTASGMAFDNIAPAPVQGVDISNQEDAKILTWQPSESNDVSNYLVYQADKNGQSSSDVVGGSSSTNFMLPNSYEGVQNFAVKTRDVNNNLSGSSKAASVIFPKRVAYDMQSGWNLIGLPVDASADSIQKVLQSASTIYKYSGGYTQVDQLKAGVGYWAKFSQEDLSELEGTPVTELTLELKEGWNLISGVGGELPLSLVKDPDEILLQNTLYEFDQAYSSSDTLLPGNGYWLLASGAGTVTFTHPKLVSDQQQKSTKSNPLAKESTDLKENFSKITVADGNHSRDLYFGSSLPKQVNKQKFGLPPLAPGEIFDARFSQSTKLIEEAEGKIQLSRIQGTDLSIKISPQNIAKQSRFLIREMVDGKVLTEYKVDAGKEVTLKHNETDAIFFTAVGNSPLSEKDMPDEFKLEQNYPNPFNPTTQIEYAVTEATTVKLEVFNILGKRVATLINERQQPGNYEVTFDGSNLASGVYLYRLQAGAHVSTKKLILAK